ncbi:unnamed protein product [Amoebophrya sp. A25]|nr:unnamed protein product [Amoebophrya sp. A25]|eukprot:GSA25T00014954001.1
MPAPAVTTTNPNPSSTATARFRIKFVTISARGEGGKDEVQEHKFIDLQLFREWAPASYDRFLQLAAAGFLDDQRFVRAIPNFVLDWNYGPTAGTKADPTFYEQELTWFKQGEANKKAGGQQRSNVAGTICFGQEEDKTAKSELFINLVDNEEKLDLIGFWPFGIVTDFGSIRNAGGGVGGDEANQNHQEDTVEVLVDTTSASASTLTPTSTTTSPSTSCIDYTTSHLTDNWWPPLVILNEHSSRGEFRTSKMEVLNIGKSKSKTSSGCAGSSGSGGGAISTSAAGPKKEHKTLMKKYVQGLETMVQTLQKSVESKYSDIFFTGGANMQKALIRQKVMIAGGNDYIDKAFPGLSRITKCERLDVENVLG